MPSQSQAATTSGVTKSYLLLLHLINNPVGLDGWIGGSKELENMNKVKRQNVESKTHGKLQDEYIHK